MSNLQHTIYIEDLKEKIDNEFQQDTPNYELITKWRTELIELGYQPEITPEEERKFWGEVLTPTKEDFEYPLQDEPDDEGRPEEDIDTNAQLRGSER